MNTPEMPPAGKYVQYDTAKSEPTSGAPVTLLKLGEGCRIDWPKKATPLASPITWHEMRQDADAVKHR